MADSRLPPGGADRSSIRRPLPDLGLETLTARYVRQSFKPHAHHQYLIGVITGGGHSVWCRGTRHDALAGTVVTMRPGDVHHGGAAAESGWSQRMVYVDERAMASLVEDGMDGNDAPLPDFACAFRRDPALALRLERIQAVLHRPDLALQRDAALVAFGEVVETLAKDGESAGRNGLAPDRRSGALVDYLHAHVGEDVPLEALASLAGLGRRQTIDLFRRRTGLPPHAYHLGLKVRLVQDLLRQGCSPAFAAAEAGFADQSHMTRHFTAIVGTTPGVYARA